MKLIQSYWSKPYYIRERSGIGGWSNKTFHYMSCALSCLKASEFYPVELVTDKNGKQILIEEIGLPYSCVSDDLEYIDYPIVLWAVGKIVAYALQNEPFLHIDNDIFIWNKFSDTIETNDLVAQSEEEDYDFNKKYYDDISKHFDYIPEQILEYREKQLKCNSVNAGILGGVNVHFFKDYTNEAFTFIERNLDKLNSLVEPCVFNLIFEQYLFYCMAKNRKKEIVYYFDSKIDAKYKELVNFWNVPNHCTYIHPLASYKRYYVIGEQITQRLWFEYPEYYIRIHELIKKNKI